MNTFKLSGDIQMQRRTALQYLPVAFAITASPGQLLDIARRAQGTVFSPQTAQEKLLVAFVDRILPATSTPSASQAGVPAFIQFALAELISPGDRDRFYTLMDQFETHCITQHGLRFDELSSSSQDAHLVVLLQQRDEFCLQLKQLTLTAYFTSQRGMTEALDYNPIPGSYNSCVHVTDETKTEASYF
ncbi:MAG TPA: gluconate 2-dehydrogenase subunit 3 family protein [Saprospiraceae bacterium]|nr:gluconate 2-dehydrogenase subunit 3 family protein [Saprospiraceae bacterium]